MLVLTRRTDESIIIDGDIRVKVLSVEGGTVRLGIEAPPEITIYRQELYEAVKEENIKAARAASRQSKQLKKLLSKTGKDKKK